ncbi:MAG TPA: methionine--tRNA ligase [Nitrososphaeraceae archaeon]|jgi:methionine--tRNA ligase beta chain|nr:methionine--tRNA ligase [Nitrososphaeraceae archaeon]
MDNEITNQSNIISFEEFSKIDLRIGRITKIEYIPKLSKVYKTEVDLGFEKRVIVVGAAMHYKPNELEGRLVILCSNLLPKKIGNIESKGMILALDGINGKPVFLTIDKEENIELGSRVH